MSFEAERAAMVERQLHARGITEPAVLAAFRSVPRHEFVPADFARQAYADHPIPIGEEQTISQPYIVALMVSQLGLQGHERVLEIGTGSGYQTAILSQLALEVYSVERLSGLLRQAEDRLGRLGYTNIHLSPGNGTLGWIEHAPYEAIIVSAAAPDVPPALLDQLADGGRMVLPVGASDGQVLVKVEKRPGQIRQTQIGGCLFVPLIGEQGWPQA